MSADAPARMRRWAFLLPLTLVAAAYLHSLSGSFVWDDHMLIEEQQVVQQLEAPWEYFRRMFWSDPLKVSRGFYRPLVTWSYALEWQLWDGQAGGFHLTNVLLHAGCALLVFALARKSGAGPLASAVAASLFGAFPRLTESVAWISGRTDVMAALAAFAALLLYDATPGAWRRRALAGVVLLPGLFSKEVALAAAAGIVALEAFWVLREGRSLRRSVLNLAPFLASLGVYGALRLYAHTSDTRRVVLQESSHLSVLERVSATFAGIGHYVRMVLDPLRPELQVGSTAPAPLGMACVGALALVAAGLGLWRVRTKLSAVQVTALAAGASALVMVLHVFVPLNVVAADRFLYVPVAMAAVAAAPLLDRLLAWSPRWGMGACAAVLAAFVVATYVRVLDWNDEHRLWTQAIRVRAPGQVLPLMGLSEYMMDHGMYAQALRLMEGAVKEDQQLAGYNNLALVLSKLGRHAEAADLFEQMVRRYPEAQRARLNLAMVYARMGRWSDAEAQLAQVEAQSPELRAVKDLRGLLTRARKTLSAPAADAEKRAEALASRAVMFEELEAPHDASLTWKALLAEPSATPEQRLRATGYLVFQGEPELASEAVGRLRRERPDLPELPVLEGELAYRMSLR